MTSSLTSSGNCALTRGITSFRPLMTSTVFAPDCRRMSSVTVGVPLRRENERCSFVPSSTRPTSRSFTGAPFTFAITRSSNWRGSVYLPNVRSVSSSLPVFTFPPGTSAFWRSSASRIAEIEIW